MPLIARFWSVQGKASLSNTLWYCIKTDIAYIMISSQSENQKTLVTLCRYQDHPEIRKGSPQRRRFMTTGASTKWRFSTFKPPYLSPKRCKMGPTLLLIANRKSHRHFRMIPKSTAMDDPGLTLNGHCALCYTTHNLSENTTRN